MKRIWFLALLVSVSLVADPFHKANRGQAQQNIDEEFLDVTEQPKNCTNFPLDSTWADSFLDSLKLVGILQQAQDWQALFVKEEQVRLVKKGSVLWHKKVRVEEISKQKVILAIPDEQNCDSETFIELTF